MHNVCVDVSECMHVWLDGEMDR